MRYKFHNLGSYHTCNTKYLEKPWIFLSEIQYDVNYIIVLTTDQGGVHKEVK